MRSGENACKIQAHHAYKLRLSEGDIRGTNRWNATIHTTQKLYGFLKHGFLKHLSVFQRKHESEYSSSPDIHPDRLGPVFDYRHSLGQVWPYLKHDENTPYSAFPHAPLTCSQQQKEQVRISKIKRFSSGARYH